VQCFLCEVKLDGWEAEDEPLREHLAHAQTCGWAISLSVRRREGKEEESRDPMSDELVAARRSTFEVGEGWMHEGKRGWRCKISNMLHAGWCLDPGPEAEDGVTCFYCNLSLDGWEPKDDPFEEHRRREPECRFFALLEQYHGDAAFKIKSKVKGKERASRASKDSRLSTLSAMSIASEAVGFADVGDVTASADDSILTTATSASQATIKGKKKGGRSAQGAATKGKGRKRANTADDDDVNELSYPDLTQSRSASAAESSHLAPLEDEVRPRKATRIGSFQSKQVDASVVDVSDVDVAPKKTTRGRKAKAQAPSQLEPELPMQEGSDGRWSEVSAQLQEELEHSMDYEAPDHESTPPAAPQSKPKRGVKRTSEGLRKEDESMRVTSVDPPIPPQPAPTKGKRGGKAKESIVAEQSDMEASTQEPDASFEYSRKDASVSETESAPVKKGGKAKKAPAKKGKGRKASSTRSSKATITATGPEPEPDNHESEDLAKDEMEIEAELARIAAEQQRTVQIEQEKTEEFEPSPSHAHNHAQQIHKLEQELQAEANAIPAPSVGMANLIATVARSPLPPKIVDVLRRTSATPSPSGSDKENQPSSAAPPTVKPAPLLSPTKTTRIPLAPGTPNQHSPGKNGLHSPSKHFSKLSSTTPWTAVDLDAVLLASPLPTPGTLADRLASAAGALTSPEKGMTVEQWVRWRAEKSEEELRRRCEEMVGGFEREGVRALECLRGLEVDP